MPAIVFVDPSAPDEPTAPLCLRNMHERSPTATFGKPVLSSTGKPVKRFDESNKAQSFTIKNLRVVGNEPTVNLPSSAEEVYPQNYTVGQPKNHISDLQFEPYARDLPVLEDEFQNRSVSWF